MSVSERNGGYRVIMNDLGYRGKIEVEGPQTAELGRYGGGMEYFLFNPPNEPGEYTVRVGGHYLGSFTVTERNRTANNLGFGWNGGIRRVDWPPASSPDESAGGAEQVSEGVDPDAGEIDPSNYRWIVNADNEEGIAPAPVLRRRGVELGPDGATFRFPDGETVDVGAVEEADEVARYLEGADAGDVIDADQDATDSGDSTGSSNSSIEPAAAAAGLLALGYALTR
jgi:hypothetical protein